MIRSMSLATKQSGPLTKAFHYVSSSVGGGLAGVCAGSLLSIPFNSHSSTPYLLAAMSAFPAIVGLKIIGSSEIKVKAAWASFAAGTAMALAIGTGAFPQHPVQHASVEVARDYSLSRR